MTAPAAGPSGPPRRRAPRADAQRNRERLLAAAEDAFREQGTPASLERIARAAGVAIGTLYGHFPTRRALLEALLRDRQQALFALGERLAADPEADPGEALERWIAAVTEHAATYDGLSAQLLGSLEDETSELYAACKRLSAAGERLVARARESGAVRAEVTAEDVFALITSAAWLRRQVPAARAGRLLGYLTDGLRPAQG